jgi:peptidoglycan hydrolase FlgJ
MGTTATLNPYTDINRLGTLRAAAKQDPDAAMKQVTREFEALFVQMMLKAARDASPEGGLFDSHEMRFYNEMFDSQVALTMAEQGELGFADALGEQLAAGQRTAANDDGAQALELPARRAFPARAEPYVPQPEPAAEDAVVDITRWSRPTSAFAVPNMVPELGGNQQRFVASVRDHAERAAQKLGTSPEILMAQAALETGWGKHVVGGGSHNLFSIKADPSWAGRTVTQRTLEVFGGKPVKISAAFRAYNNVGDAFDDYVGFIQQNPRYQRALERASDPRAYVQELQRAGYATDPGYAQKILQIHGRLAGSSPPRG